MVAATCVAASAGLPLANSGSIADALIAATLDVAQLPQGFNLWGHVSDFISATAGNLYAIAKPIVHGVVSGAISVAQGGDFMSGFVGGAAGAVGGMLGTEIFGPPESGFEADPGGFIGRTAIASVLVESAQNSPEVNSSTALGQLHLRICIMRIRDGLGISLQENFKPRRLSRIVGRILAYLRYCGDR